MSKKNPYFFKQVFLSKAAYVNAVFASFLLMFASQSAAEDQDCSRVKLNLLNAGVEAGDLSSVLGDYLERLETSPWQNDFLSVVSSDGRRIMTAAEIFKFSSDRPVLRTGRTQIVAFDSLKRIRRTAFRMDYIVVVGKNSGLTEKKVDLLLAEARSKFSRFFPVVRNEGEAYLAGAQRLAEESGGALTNLSAPSCLKTSTHLSTDKAKISEEQLSLNLKTDSSKQLFQGRM